MADAVGELITIDADGFDVLVDRVRTEQSTELILIGSEYPLAADPDEWPEDLRSRLVHRAIALPGDLAERLSELEHLTRLDLRSLQMGDDGATGLAQGLPNLTTLNLQSNQIGHNGATALAQGLPNLTTLNLQSNQIGHNGATALAQGLPNLTTLNLWNNQIGHNGATALAQGLPNLTTLTLGNNQIGDDGATGLAQGLPNLTTLTLGNNQIGDDGATALAQGLPNLTTLNLQSNQIGHNGATALAQGLPNLTTLNLWNNQIGHNGATALAQGLPNLTTLNLANNQIGHNGATALAQGLPNLTTLTLANNQIGPDGATALAQGLPNLTTLNLGNNQIGPDGATELAQGLPNLTTLTLWNNQIGDDGATALAQGLPNLTTLNLQSNQIGPDGATALAQGLPNLTTLDLDDNRIGDDGATGLAQGLPNLTTLNLSGSDVSELSPFRPLLVEGMQVSTDRHMGRGLMVEDCPIETPPIEVVQQGRAAVLNYFDDLDKQGIDHLYEAKVLVVGEPHAGKTSLICRLYDPDSELPAEAEFTRGIDISHHEFRDPEGRTFRLNIWDFGGQDIYWATHQFFLTKNSLYILLDDTRKNHTSVNDEGFKYWLDVIDTYSDHSPVLIFQNEKDNHGKQIDEAGIRARFDNVKDVYSGNLATHGSADELGERIELEVRRLPHVGEEVPAKWVTIRNSLEELAESVPYISQQDYFDLYSEHVAFDHEKALHLSRYLHDLGAFLHFQDDYRLADTIVLQNPWATDAVFAVIDDETIKANNGRFSIEDCRRTWSDPRYAGAFPQLLALMEKFEIAYTLPDTEPESWLVPQLLPLKTPAEARVNPEPDDLVLTYRYDFLPKGLINRLMVRMNRYLRDPLLSWRSGAVFQRGETTVIAHEGGDDKLILRARGREAAHLRNVIAADLDALNKSIHGLRGKVDKLVPCTCDECTDDPEPWEFSEKTLRRAKQRNRVRIECQKSFEMVPVLTLLEGLRLDKLPGWAASADPQDRAASEPPGPQQNEPAVQRITVFLAGSEQLSEVRDGLEIALTRRNKTTRRYGYEVEVDRWEAGILAMAAGRSQDEYNERIEQSDVFIAVFDTKAGNYTVEEFETARKAFADTGKPVIYAIFLETQMSTSLENQDALMSLWAFQKQLKRLDYFWTTCRNPDDVTRTVTDQLDQLADDGRF